MANKWLDPGGGWTLADWEDTTQTVLMSHFWDTLKGAADERVAFSELTHDSGFPASKDFPDFNNDKSLYLATGNTSKIQLGIYPENCVQTDEVNSSGTDTTAPTTLSLSALLTGPLSYASGSLLQSIKGLPLMTWIEQYFLVMNYPVFYWRPVLTETGGADHPWITDLESQWVSVAVDYDYDIPGDSLINVEARYTTPTSGGGSTDFYVTNDLNETSPWSTPQEVRDYAVAELENQRDTATWATGVNNLSGIQNVIDVSIDEEVKLDIDDKVFMTMVYRSTRFRFKLADQYRAASPNRYTVPIQHNFYWSDGIFASTFDDFGLTKTDGNVELVTITKDVNDWYTFEISGADYDNTTVPSVPTTGTGPATNTNEVGMSKTPIPPTTKTGQGYYMKPNQSDESAWEYYEP